MSGWDDYEHQLDEYHDGYGDPYIEAIGSCDECECDLYENDCYYIQGYQFCGQCYWMLKHS